MYINKKLLLNSGKRLNKYFFTEARLNESKKDEKVNKLFKHKLKTLDKSLNEGFYDKEVYERKRAYAQRMRDKDREDAIGLTYEQCDVLEWLCTVRHEIHTNQEDVFYSESSNNEKFLRWIDSEINEKLKDVGLSTIKFSHDAEDFPDDYTWELDYDDYEKAYYDCIDMVEDINKDIEHYLAKIDEEHNTHYCPTRASRIF